MIGNFKHRGLKRPYEREDRGIRPDLVDRVGDILARLDAAQTAQALDLPGYRLHQLEGDLKGFWAVTDHFRFENGRAHYVEFDYH